MSGRATAGLLADATMRLRMVVVLAVVLVLGGIVVVSTSVGRSDGHLMLTATFKDASPLLVGNDVRLAGVKVGSVAALQSTGDTARVTLELDAAALPVHADAKLVIRPVSLLGERYVELDRGSAGAPVLADGGHLGLDHTGASVDLDQVLDSLDDPTSAALATLVGTLGDGMDGNGRQVARTLQALAPALTHTHALTAVLRRQNSTLARVVTSLSAVASGLASGDGSRLDRLVASAETLLSATRTHESAFRSMLAELPSTLRSARRTLGVLQTTAGSTTPTLRALRPTTRNLPAISRELKAFADAADPALVALNPVLRKADGLLAKARPVAALLRQQAPDLTADARSLDPLSRSLAGDFTSVMQFIRGWALATNGEDGLSHYFRAGLVLTEYSVTGLLPGTASGARTTTTSGGPGAGGRGGGAAGPLGGLGNQVGGLVGGVTGLLQGLLAPRTDRRGGVTGLTPAQESGAVSFLLGGS